MSYWGAVAEIMTLCANLLGARSTASPCDSLLKIINFGAPSCGIAFIIHLGGIVRARRGVRLCARSVSLSCVGVEVYRVGAFGYSRACLKKVLYFVTLGA